LVILRTDNEAGLEELAAQAKSMDVQHTVFQEPDLWGSTTAIALGPEAKSLVKKLPLAFREAA
jgi:peptidyl-tRNA hydrolase